MLVASIHLISQSHRSYDFPMDHLEPLSPTLAEAQPSGSDISAKHRKIRRGTRSCWDCKRRKVRCIFASSTDAVCSNCRRRGSICVSQDLPEALAPARDEQISDRIVRVEELVNSLARQARSTTGPAPTGGSSAQGHLGAVTPSYTGSEVTTAQVRHRPRKAYHTKAVSCP